MNRTPQAVKTVQETFFCEEGEGKTKVLSKEETKRMLERKTCNFERIDLVQNSPSTKYKIINAAAKCEHRLRMGRREIIHLELFIINVIFLLNNSK